MDPKTVIRDYWASYERGELEATWSRYIAEDIVIHPGSGPEVTRQSWL